ncbi:transposable element Tcb1 transposase [Trichonephila clavipes]|nr:transposable element Tcb1 transposase [Trichonephila clavipes]
MMSSLRFRRPYKQLNDFERGHIVGMYEAGWSDLAIGHHLQRRYRHSCAKVLAAMLLSTKWKLCKAKKHKCKARSDDCLTDPNCSNDAIPENAGFQSALSNDIDALHLELWFGDQFRTMDDPISYELSPYMQLLPWPTYSPDMSPIEHVWDLVGRRLSRDPLPTASKEELLLLIQAIWKSLPQADI